MSLSLRCSSASFPRQEDFPASTLCTCNDLSLDVRRVWLGLDLSLCRSSRGFTERWRHGESAVSIGVASFAETFAFQFLVCWSESSLRRGVALGRPVSLASWANVSGTPCWEVQLKFSCSGQVSEGLRRGCIGGCFLSRRWRLGSCLPKAALYKTSDVHLKSRDQLQRSSVNNDNKRYPSRLSQLSCRLGGRPWSRRPCTC